MVAVTGLLAIREALQEASDKRKAGEQAGPL
jgi:hypothetical protein